MDRKAGVVLPLFSVRTRRDWGIGQITDLPTCAAWIRSAGHRLVQVLPPHELSDGETSPYGALTAFGIDPIYVDLEAIEDLDPAAIAQALGEAGERSLQRVRSAQRVDYAAVRAIKVRVFKAAFQRFCVREWERGSERAQKLAHFVRSEHAWLDDLALYVVLREAHGGCGWRTWPQEERERSLVALQGARERYGARMLEVAYMQWILLGQWQKARERMRDLGVDLMGDVPFVVGIESADVWSHASQFQLHIELGAPPDDFSAEGQAWGLPPYDWLAMEGDDLAWIRARTRRAARLYDRFRLDHVVGYFRQWVKRAGIREPGRFDPDGMGSQCARGRRVLGAMLEELRACGRAAGAVDPPRAVAEDLGVVPPFVRQVLRELEMPGYCVLPWEKEGNVFRDPRDFPNSSVASWSTHDTPPIVAWWDQLPQADRAELSRRTGVLDSMDDDTLSLALLRYLYAAGSDLALVLVQELLGSRDRINTPATVGPQNWTWRLPQPVEDLAHDARLGERFRAIGDLIAASGR